MPRGQEFPVPLALQDQWAQPVRQALPVPQGVLALLEPRGSPDPPAVLAQQDIREAPALLVV